MITLADYFMGRDRQFAIFLSPDIKREAARTCELATAVMAIAKTAGVRFEVSPRTGSFVSSGWRPPAVNCTTPGAAPKSKHITGQAVDIYDPEGDFDEWLITPDGLKTLKDFGVWIEHPSATKSWSHLQTIPPRSGNRVFYP